MELNSIDEKEIVKEYILGLIQKLDKSSKVYCETDFAVIFAVGCGCNCAISYSINVPNCISIYPKGAQLPRYVPLSDPSLADIISKIELEECQQCMIKYGTD